MNLLPRKTCRNLVLLAALAAATAWGCVRSAPEALPQNAAPPRPANRLARESSPYLLQHAHNPVDWYPWGEEALARARKEGKPIFLSIGYAACHWCHVMERESFENEEIARLLNEQFVAIKVDREERPDLDDLYMSAVQMLTGRGGWPMSVFLTPEGKPFFGGTYFPPDDFKTLLGKVAEAWKTRRADVDKAAAQIAAEMERRARAASASSALPSRALLAETLAALRDEYDKANGGFGSAPKFPPHTSFPLLFHAAARGDKEALQMALGTLDAMARGGIRDHLGGGFHRYSTDEVWLVPHFEKMLYDNALLARAYADAYRLTGKPLYREVAQETLDWALREMRGPEGGFYSSLDADSEGEEGKFYLWTKGEILDTLGPTEGALFCDIYNVEEAGNYAEQSTREKNGKNILHLKKPLAALTPPAPLSRFSGRGVGGEGKAFLESLAKMRAKLLAVRARRMRPSLDDKRLTSWNALMIGSLAYAGRVLKEPRYIAAAAMTADFVIKTLHPGDRLLRRFRPGTAERARGAIRRRDGVPPSNPQAKDGVKRRLRDDQGRRGEGETHIENPIPAFLEDYAYLTDALLDLYEAEKADRWRTEARRMADEMIARFADPRGGFFDTPDDHEKLLLRLRSSFDQAIPSGNAVAARALLRLTRLSGEPAYRVRAAGTLQAFGTLLARSPRAAQTMVTAAAMYLEEERNAEHAKRSTQHAAASKGPVRVSGAFDARSGLTLTIAIAQGWHINANRPLDRSLVPTRVEVTMPKGVTAGAPVYPPARTVRLGFSTEPLAVYAGTITVRVPLKTAKPGQYVVMARLRYQPCDDRACLAPETLTVAVPGIIARRASQ